MERRWRFLTVDVLTEETGNEIAAELRAELPATDVHVEADDGRAVPVPRDGALTAQLSPSLSPAAGGDGGTSLCFVRPNHGVKPGPNSRSNRPRR